MKRLLRFFSRLADAIMIFALLALVLRFFGVWQ